MPSGVKNVGLLKAYRLYPNGTTGDVGFTNYAYTDSFSRSDSVRRVKPKDLFANGTSRSASRTTISQGMGAVHEGGGTYLKAPCAYWITAGTPLGGWPDLGTLTGAQSKMRGKIKAENLNLAQDLAEYRQASRLYADLSKDIFDTLRSLRRGTFLVDAVRYQTINTKRYRTKNLANRWLQYQYGLRPLVQDLYSVTDALRNLLEEGKVVHKTSVFRSSWSTTERPFSGGIRRYWELEDTTCKARYTISSGVSKTLASMGISNPLLLVWELIPYSFVFDWMFPVGHYLASLDALNGVSNLLVQCTTRTTRYSEASAYGAQWNQTMTLYSRGGVSTGLSMPRLSYKPSTSLTAVLNGLALLTQIRHNRWLDQFRP